jgi:hypothetical protein
MGVAGKRNSERMSGGSQVRERSGGCADPGAWPIGLWLSIHLNYKSTYLFVLTQRTIYRCTHRLTLDGCAGVVLVYSEGKQKFGLLLRTEKVSGTANEDDRE